MRIAYPWALRYQLKLTNLCYIMTIIMIKLDIFRWQKCYLTWWGGGGGHGPAVSPRSPDLRLQCAIKDPNIEFNSPIFNIFQNQCLSSFTSPNY